MRAVERALLDQERDPLLVAVVRHERVIEIEQGEDVGAQREQERRKSYNDG